MDQTEDITKEDWAEASAEAWRDMLSDLWAEQVVALSPSIYWIALRGALHEPADPELEIAATDLISAAQDGSISVYGYTKSSPWLANIPPEAFFGFKRLIPELREIDSLNDGCPHLFLNFVLAPGDRDKIASCYDEILADSLCVRRDELMSRWKPGRAALRDVCARLFESDGAIAQKAAWEIVRKIVPSTTRAEFTEEWKTIVGVQKTGPRGPRIIGR